MLQKPVVTARDEAFTALAACPGQPAWLAMAATGKVMSLWLRGGQVEHRIVDAQVECFGGEASHMCTCGNTLCTHVDTSYSHT